MSNLRHRMNKFLINYCPTTSEEEFAESLTLAGALHTFDEVLKADQAEFLAVLQAVFAVFTDLLNVAQATFTAELTAGRTAIDNATTTADLVAI